MSQDKKSKKHVEETKRKEESDSDQEESSQEQDVDVDDANPVDKDGIPKAPRNAYLFYSKDARARITKANPNLSSSEINKIIKKDWAALGNKDKEAFEKLHALDSIRYYKAMAQLKKDRPELFESKAEAKQHASPKKHPAVSAYMMFSADWRNSLPEEGRPAFSEQGKLCSLAWKDVSDEKKKHYQKLANEENERRQSMTDEQLEKERKEREKEKRQSKKRKAEGSADDEPVAKKAKTESNGKAGSPKKTDEKKKDDKQKEKEKQKQREKEKEKEKEKERKKKERKEKEKEKTKEKKKQSESSEESSSD